MQEMLLLELLASIILLNCKSHFLVVIHSIAMYSSQSDKTHLCAFVSLVRSTPIAYALNPSSHDPSTSTYIFLAPNIHDRSTKFNFTQINLIQHYTFLHWNNKNSSIR